MNINQLKYLSAISQYPSLNIAAEHLHITPQSLGASIKLLERELGVQLLERGPRGSVLTPKAQELVQIGGRFLNELEHFLTQLRQANGEIRIAASFDSFYGYLPHVLQNLYQIAPELKIYVRHMITEDVIQSVQSQEADLGFIFQEEKAAVCCNFCCRRS